MARTVEALVAGEQHGFIRRLVSPGELGERLKPFVFLDYLNGLVPKGAGFGFHPHSGIATLTYQLNADAAYEDTTGQKGIVKATGLEWMRAGGGTWHQGFIHPHDDFTEGFQLWVALPPEQENGDSQGLYIQPERVPQVDNVRVLLGEYAGQRSPIPLPSPLNYLDVVLEAGQRWTYTPPAGHTVAWIFVYRGLVETGETTAENRLVVFADSEAPFALHAKTPSRVLLGSARKHEHPLVLGPHSVHTSARGLKSGVARIQEVAEQLRREGRL